MSVILKGAKLYSPEKKVYFEKYDILIEKNIIKKIEKNIEVNSGEKIINLENKVLCAGFIDSHVHCYPEENKFGVEPDKIGIEAGISTLIDAGSSGANNFENFYNKYIMKRDTDIFCFLNLAEDGIKYGKELSDLTKINLLKLKEVILKYPNIILGTKLRMSSSIVGDNGIKPIEINNKLLKELKIKTMIHIGNAPPRIEEILNNVGEGYIITHFLHGKENGIFKNGKIIPEFYKGKERGVLFDLGHGSASFSKNSFDIAMKNGIFPDTISSDVHTGNINGKVKNLIYILNKLLKMGVDFEKVILGVTEKPAKIFNLEDRGSIEIGKKAIFTILNGEGLERKEIIVEGIFTKEKMIKVNTEQQKFNNLLLEIQNKMEIDDEVFQKYYDDLIEIEKILKKANINFKYDSKYIFYSRITSLIIRLKNKSKLEEDKDINFDEISEKAFTLAKNIMLFLSEKYEGEFDKIEMALISIQLQLAIDMEEK